MAITDKDGQPLQATDLVSIPAKVVHDPNDGSGVIHVELTEPEREVDGKPIKTVLRVQGRQTKLLQKGPGPDKK